MVWAGFRMGREGSFDVPYHASRVESEAPRFSPMLPHACASDGEADVPRHSGSKDAERGMVSRRQYFARLIELRAQFGQVAAARDDEGPFEEKDHPCLVRQSTARKRATLSRVHSAPNGSRRVSSSDRQAQTAPTALDHLLKPVPFRDTILTCSLPRPCFEAETLNPTAAHRPTWHRLGTSPRSEGTVSLRCASHAASDSVWFDGSDGHAHRNGTAPVHPYRLLSPPGLFLAAGPPPSARGDRRTPVISVQKMTPEKKIKKAELKAHVVKLHSVMASSLQQVDVGVLDVLAKRREQFLLRALHYLGIPYKAGARPRSDQPMGAAALAQAANFDKAPLYLDCCGLVRRCLLDLADTLDIVVGPYNQAYLYDTLPIILSEQDLCPGDLVFIQGRYKDPNKARPKHDIVHVEIFLGGVTGKSSLGARDRYGAVDIFDSYSFESKSYEVVQYHFRSLDTWLGGVCRSWCAQHRWVTATRRGRQSVRESGAAEVQESRPKDGLRRHAHSPNSGWVTGEAERPQTGGPQPAREEEASPSGNGA